LAETFTAYYQSPVGLLRIAGTSDCISEVSFQDTAAENFQQNGLPPLAIQCIEQLIQYFSGQRRVFELPICQQGTPFQLETWSQLMTIPFGKTISYIQLAIRTGDQKASRAVAAASGKNHVAIIVPCHRVIGSNRELVGYGGGLWRKKWLLEHELKVAYGVQTLF
jgi:O-6-methylguanine DNA methyltransferase